MENSSDCVECRDPMASSDLTMCSPDGRFRVRVGCCQLESLMAMCRRSGDLETGGVLIGRYNEAHDTAMVTRAMGPTSDSVRGRTSFWRGIQGLQQRINALWKDREYYLGEWHYHPRGAGQPSVRDKRQMVRIAESLDYNTPEPVLIVVGGSRWEVTAYVFPRHGHAVNLT
ncbi:MAG: hypothetical protein F4Y63_06290 [Chloroflexi bacterium]|nr:hypothetical protein [Chloroflexota bacterium]MYK60459.1 hypothetical protein [Chloroflexota bacterium]